MTDLTEQWKKGELPYAEYYIKLAGGEYTNDVWDVDGWQSFNKKDDVVVEVLAKMPSYEEWDKLNNACHELEKETACLTVDIVKLKKLLKECRDILLVDEMNATAHYKKALQGLLTKINQVLGEE